MQRRSRPARRLLLLFLVLPAGALGQDLDWAAIGAEGVEKLRAYVRIDTTNPPGNETPAAELLQGWLQAEGIATALYDPLDNRERQALVARLPGTSGRTIVLMSHSDVVGAESEDWTHPPFAAEIAEGLLYGRGTLDTKGLGILQLMTFLLLQRQGLHPRDELLLLIEPDEEEGGDGMRGMLEKYPELFRHVRLVLNEGGAGSVGLLNEGQTIFFVQTAEKGVAWMRVGARGDSGHGSVPLPNNAVVTMARALTRIAAYQTPMHPSRTVVALFHTLADQLTFPRSFVMRHVDNPIVQAVFARQLTEKPLINALLRTTISLTGVQGGFKTNVIPAEVEATLDCRVTVGDSAETLRMQLVEIVDDPRVEVEIVRESQPNESPIDPELMEAVRTVAAGRVPGSIVAPFMSSGGTDSAFFRHRGVPAYGFNPIVLTEGELATMHGANERVPVGRFSDAIRMYYEVIAELAGVRAAAGGG
jgi:acetylornithine deacetylase/succinyl-diaminopimelate desuccinylase-like protein